MTTATKVSAQYLYAGYGDYFGGHGCADDADHSEHLLYAHYNGETTLRDIIDQLVEDSYNGPASETLPDDLSDDAVRTALLDMFSDSGRADYESGALAECSFDFAANNDLDDGDESPVYIVLLDCAKSSRRTKGAVLVGRKDQEYWFIDSVFEHGTDLAGCTGMVVYPISEESADQLLEPENMKDRFEDAWEETFKESVRDDCRDCCFGVNEEGCEYCGYPSLLSWCGGIADCDGIDSVIDDAGYEYTKALVEKGVDAEYTDCCGCGRIFSREDVDDFDEVYNRKALVACLAYEDGTVDYDYTAKVIYG